MENGDWVSWETSHFGIKQIVTSQIIETIYFYGLDSPRPLSIFTHTHAFIEQDKGTMMIDTFIYTAPFGILGKIADRLFLERYMQELISIQAQKVKVIAEENYSCNLDERE